MAADSPAGPPPRITTSAGRSTLVGGGVRGIPAARFAASSPCRLSSSARKASDEALASIATTADVEPADASAGGDAGGSTTTAAAFSLVVGSSPYFLLSILANLAVMLAYLAATLAASDLTELTAAFE